jgi:hypothetical protein
MQEPQNERSNRIDQSDVVRWMASDDIEALGALFNLLTNAGQSRRIHPPLSFGDYQAFVMRYLDRCFRENPDGEWSDSRYTAGWSLANWFRMLWSDSSVPRSALFELKSWLASLYREADEDLRTCLVNATLEHVFGSKEIARFFADWQEDDVLGKAYADAIEWSVKR